MCLRTHDSNVFNKRPPAIFRSRLGSEADTQLACGCYVGVKGQARIRQDFNQLSDQRVPGKHICIPTIDVSKLKSSSICVCFPPDFEAELAPFHPTCTGDE